MSVLPRCICDPFKAIVGDYDPRCNRHIGTPRPTFAPESPCVCPNPCKWCAMEFVKAQWLNTTPVVSQKPANLSDNAAEVDRDSDGELLIDWSPGQGRMVSLSLRADGRLSYAFTWDGEKAHGTAQMPAASSNLKEDLRKLHATAMEAAREFGATEEELARCQLSGKAVGLESDAAADGIDGAQK